MDFFLFILVNATLFIRPGELIPATEGWPIYNCVIILNLLVAAPGIVNELSERSLSRSPTTICVLGVFVFTVLSLLARFELESAWNTGFEFAKVVAYFLLLMATVNTPRRLFTLLAAVAACTVAVNVLAVMQHHGQIDLPSLRGDFEGRMHATGIFGDPNDLSTIIVASIMICAGGLFYKQFGFFRLLLVAPIGFLGYSLTLTQSRGGLVGLLAGCGALIYARFGLVRATLLGAVLFPILLAGFAGRQSDLSGAITSGGTGRTRVELWSDGLYALKASPLLGVGANHYGEIANGRVAHNSFVHAFVELGFFGGALFLGSFALTGWSLWLMLALRNEIAHPGLRYYLPYLIGTLVAFGVSIMTLSRSYEVPTFLMAGCAAVFERLAQPGTALRPAQLDGKTLARLGVFSVSFLLVVHLYIKVLLRWN